MAHEFDLKTAGKPLEEAKKALIMVHGRGGSADDILTVASHLHVEDFALLAPQATNHTWYPYSFMAPADANEPWLKSAIEYLVNTYQIVEDAGIPSRNIFFFGFSQGACLILEFIAREARFYGGASALIGGLIGKEIERSKYQGDFQGTPIFLGTSDPDFHVPLERVEASQKILEEMHANVTLRVYKDFAHTIHPDQIEWTNRMLKA